MWFRNVFLKTLRDCRAPILGWGLGLGVLAPTIFAGAPLLLDSPAAREAVLAFTRNPAVQLFAEPVDVLSPGGYATWRLAVLLPMLGIWALLAVTRVTRGEEESGALDLLLSASGSPLRTVLEKLAAIAAALLLIGVVIAVLALAGARATLVTLEPLRALLFGLNTALFALVFGTIALVISQFTRERRPAAGISGLLLGLSFALTSVGRAVPGGEWIGRLSPLHYFELNKPLVVGHAVSARGLVVMTTLVVVLAGIGLALFVRRDIGAPCMSLVTSLPRRRNPRGLPWHAWSLQSLVGRSVRAVAMSALWWGAALGAYSVLLTALLRQVQQNLDDLLADLGRSNPAYAELIDRFTRGGDIAGNMAFLNGVFTLLVVVVAGFAVSLAGRWASEEEDGRLALVLATPSPRTRVLLANVSASALGLTIVTGFIFVGTAAAAAASGLQLDTARVAAAAFGMLPVGLVVVSTGYVLAGWLRTRAVTGALIALVLASFVLTLLAPLFNWPAALRQLSIFEQYGSPLVDGLQPRRMLVQLGIAATLLWAATSRFATKDITSN